MNTCLLNTNCLFDIVKSGHFSDSFFLYNFFIKIFFEHGLDEEWGSCVYIAFLSFYSSI